MDSETIIHRDDSGWYVTSYGRTYEDVVREIKNGEVKVTAHRLAESLKEHKRKMRAARK